MRRRSRTVRLCAALVLTLATSFVLLTPANAAYSEWDYVTSHEWLNGPAYCMGNHGDAFGGNPTAYGCFQRDGDYLQLADASTDKKRVAMWWYTDYGRSGVCVNAKGKDWTLRSPFHFPSGKYACNRNFREGSVITFRVATCYAATVNCANRKNWGEWSDARRVRNDN